MSLPFGASRKMHDQRSEEIKRMSENTKPARPKERAELLAEAHMAGHIQLKQRDQEFLEGVVEKDRDSLSQKQEAWLSDIEKRASQ